MVYSLHCISLYRTCCLAHADLCDNMYNQVKRGQEIIGKDAAVPIIIGGSFLIARLHRSLAAVAALPILGVVSGDMRIMPQSTTIGKQLLCTPVYLV